MQKKPEGGIADRLGSGSNIDDLILKGGGGSSSPPTFSTDISTKNNVYGPITLTLLLILIVGGGVGADSRNMSDVHDFWRQNLVSKSWQDVFGVTAKSPFI